MKLIDCAFIDLFFPAFFPVIPLVNFLFLPEISNFTLRQFSIKRNVAILIYKHCMYDECDIFSHGLFDVSLCHRLLESLYYAFTGKAYLTVFKGPAVRCRYCL